MAERIRARMRHELYERGIISPQQFEAEVRANAIQSQEREGLRNPYGEEAAEILGDPPGAGARAADRSDF